MQEALATITTWGVGGILLAALIFGFAPVFALRAMVLLYPSGHPRREELIAELDSIPRHERVFWVAEQIATVAFDAIPVRYQAIRVRRFLAAKRKAATVWTRMRCPVSINLTVFLIVQLAKLENCHDRTAGPASKDRHDRIAGFNSSIHWSTNASRTVVTFESFDSHGAASLRAIWEEIKLADEISEDEKPSFFQQDRYVSRSMRLWRSIRRAKY